MSDTDDEVAECPVCKGTYCLESFGDDGRCNHCLDGGPDDVSGKNKIEGAEAQGGPLPTQMYALFVYDPIYNTTTFAYKHASKEALLVFAADKFKTNVWFAVYKFDSGCRLFLQNVPAGKWYLDTKKAQPDATKYISCYTPMEVAYQIDDGHEWIFKSF